MSPSKACEVGVASLLTRGSRVFTLLDIQGLPFHGAYIVRNPACRAKNLGKSMSGLCMELWMEMYLVFIECLVCSISLPSIIPVCHWFPYALRGSFSCGPSEKHKRQHTMEAVFRNQPTETKLSPLATLPVGSERLVASSSIVTGKHFCCDPNKHDPTNTKPHECFEQVRPCAAPECPCGWFNE